MQCSICQAEIEAKKTPDGKVYWDKGHNARPVTDGRCCDYCNSAVVIPARIKQMIEERK